MTTVQHLCWIPHLVCVWYPITEWVCQHLYRDTDDSIKLPFTERTVYFSSNNLFRVKPAGLCLPFFILWYNMQLYCNTNHSLVTGKNLAMPVPPMQSFHRFMSHMMPWMLTRQKYGLRIEGICWLTVVMCLQSISSSKYLKKTSLRFLKASVIDHLPRLYSHIPNCFNIKFFITFIVPWY